MPKLSFQPQHPLVYVQLILVLCGILFLHQNPSMHLYIHPLAGGNLDLCHSNSAVRTRVITKYVFSHASVHITKRALTINVVPLFHRPILYGNIIKRSFNPLLTYMIEFEFEYLF